MKTTSKRIVIILYQRQHGKCEYCKADLYGDAMIGKDPHIDHKKPQINGGDGKIENLCITCADCNRQKGKKSETEFRIYLQPFLDGKLSRKELRDYSNLQKLKEKFKNIK